MNLVGIVHLHDFGTTYIIQIKYSVMTNAINFTDSYCPVIKQLVTVMPSPKKRRTIIELTKGGYPNLSK